MEPPAAPCGSLRVCFGAGCLRRARLSGPPARWGRSNSTRPSQTARGERTRRLWTGPGTTPCWGTPDKPRQERSETLTPSSVPQETPVLDDGSNLEGGSGEWVIPLGTTLGASPVEFRELGWALCPAWFPKVSLAARRVICIAARAPAEAEAGPVESLGVSVRVRTRGKIFQKNHNNLVRSLTERAHVQSNTKCEQ